MVAQLGAGHYRLRSRKMQVLEVTVTHSDRVVFTVQLFDATGMARDGQCEATATVDSCVFALEASADKADFELVLDSTQGGGTYTLDLVSSP